MSERPPTIYDVARAAGVAASTVSRAFSRPGRVNAATAERIRKIAAELGYRANPLAAALPTGRTHMLALVVSDVTNPVYAAKAARSTSPRSIMRGETGRSPNPRPGLRTPVRSTVYVMPPDGDRSGRASRMPSRRAAA